ncbi:MAG: hypothetical protein LRY63_07790 [Nitrincola sp.]|nr:hypothetical protein [Nitrincola sp.]
MIEFNYTSISHVAAFKMGNSILNNWGCSAAQKHAILGILRSSFHRYLKDLTQ